MIGPAADASDGVPTFSYLSCRLRGRVCFLSMDKLSCSMSRKVSGHTYARRIYSMYVHRITLHCSTMILILPIIITPITCTAIMRRPHTLIAPLLSPHLVMHTISQKDSYIKSHGYYYPATTDAIHWSDAELYIGPGTL